MYNQVSNYFGSGSGGLNTHLVNAGEHRDHNDHNDHNDRGERPPRFQRYSGPNLRSHSESLEGKMKNLLAKVRELERRIHREDKERRKSSPSHEVHSLESDPIDHNALDQDTCVDENGDEDFASQVVDAYLAQVNLVDSSTSSKAWYLDLGASNHVTGDSSVFSFLSPSSRTKIISTGGHSHDVIGIGNVAICLSRVAIQKKSHVLYSRGITKNLILVGFLANRGFSLEFLKSKCIIKTSKVGLVGSANRNSGNGLYKLQGDTLMDCSEVSALEVHNLHYEDSSKVALWHRRLGHYHFQGIRRMMQFGAVKDLLNIAISNFPCSTCPTRKQNRKSIPKVKSTMSTLPLQLIHSNVAGPFRVRFLRGASYFLTFIDDYSKKTWIYFLSSKDQVLENFKIFHQEMERIFGHKIGILRTNDSQEYTSKAFYSYCASFGILWQLSQPYTPQHNGVAERKNRTILDIVRCLLVDRQVPSHL